MTLNFDFSPAQQAVEPAVPEMSEKQWVVDAWRKLYYQMPSPGLKERVAQAEAWLAQKEAE